MKKLFFVFLLGASCLFAYGQGYAPQRPNQLNLNDFAKAYSHESSYDENFTPILKLYFKNVSQKTITTIEINADYYGYDAYDYFAPICKRTISMTISPNETKALTIKFDKDPHSNQLKTFWINRIRFSDGSIIDK